MEVEKRSASFLQSLARNEEEEEEEARSVTVQFQLRNRDYGVKTDAPRRCCVPIERESLA